MLKKLKYLKEKIHDKYHPFDNVYSHKVPKEGVIYTGNPEHGAENIDIKEQIIRDGGPFEWPDMLNTNQVVASLIDKNQKIVNIGSGTGTLEMFANRIENISIISSEFDKKSVEWCLGNRQYKNVEYTSLSINELINKYNKFDLAIAIEVIEHLEDYISFLKEFSLLSNKCIITTPNKDRDVHAALGSKPPYFRHVREWDSGELYWILKSFYKEVKLYSTPNTNKPDIMEIGLLSSYTPLIAVCENPSSVFSN